MISNRLTLPLYAALIAVVPFMGPSAAAQQNTPSTLQIVISLPISTIHVNEDPLIRITISNPTDHIVWASDVISVEIVNDKGDDVAPRAMGGDKHPDSGFVLSAKRQGIRPNSKSSFNWPAGLEPASLVPGIYKVRVHKRDETSKTEVYSNTVTLTVLH
jgi:hypothetical protein